MNTTVIAPTLPLPGDTFDGGTVIASCWQNDTDPDIPIWAELLLLTPEPGRHYRLVEIEHNVSDWTVTGRTAFENIIPATEAYSDAIGGH